MGKAESFFDDPDFQDSLVGLLCQDIATLRRCAALLKPDDFKPLHGMRHGRARWIVAERALDHYKKYGEPLGKLLRASYLEYAQQIGLGARQVAELQEYQKYLQTLKLVGGQAIADKIVEYKRQRAKALAIQELIDLQATGQLTDEKWLDTSRKALELFQEDNGTKDYFAELQDRIERRRIHKDTRRAPLLLIDPIDSQLRRAVEPGELGLVLAPYKRGKSMFLLHVAVAYVLQRLHVLYLTLEDPVQSVEDRIDSHVTEIPFNLLGENPQTTVRYFQHYRLFVRTKLKLKDCTLGGWTTQRIEQLVQQERDRGFFPDALIVDYDAKVATSQKYKDRRYEYDLMYNEFIQMASRYNLILWTGAQTQRNTRNLKVLSGDRLAEDINKVNNSTMAIGLGKGDWGDDSIYLWVAAHRFDRMEVGANIMSDKSRALIYDREATRKKIIEEEANKDDTV